MKIGQRNWLLLVYGQSCAITSAHTHPHGRTRLHTHTQTYTFTHKHMHTQSILPPLRPHQVYFSPVLLISYYFLLPSIHTHSNFYYALRHYSNLSYTLSCLASEQMSICSNGRLMMTLIPPILSEQIADVSSTPYFIIATFRSQLLSSL